MAKPNPWSFWVDTGGTFTDCLAQDPTGALMRLKVLSTGAVRGEVVAVDAQGSRATIRGLPSMPPDGYAGYAVQRLGGGRRGAVWRSLSLHERQLQHVDLTPEVTGAFAVGDVVDLSADEEAPVLAMRLIMGLPLSAPMPPAELRLATTRGTNALLEGRGARVALFVTEGFEDLLRIGDQRRPDLFALNVRKPPPLHGPVVEVRERLGADGTIVRPLDVVHLRAAAETMVREGITVAAVALLHSYRNPAHEEAVAAQLRAAGFMHVSVSSALAPFIKILPRAETAVVDAVLAPVMNAYLDGVAEAVDAATFFVMSSAGGLVRRPAYQPKDSLLSGPAGGVAGAAAVARAAGLEQVLTFDMGGTSTDVARWAGDFDYRFQHAVGAARVLAPALRVESVAAGGGSICRFDGTAFVVGPESAGAFPGPACYGAGGPLTLTDVNLLLGRLDPGTFAVPIDVAAAEQRLQELLAEVRETRGDAPGRQETLEGFIAIANERMADAIRRISVREGYDPAEHALVAFGGAGGLHACAVAARLGVKRILFPAHSGLLSASGLRHAVPERFAERQVLAPLAEAVEGVEALIADLEQQAREQLTREDGVPPEEVHVRRAELELRFAGQEAGLVVDARPITAAAERFRAKHLERYGYMPDARPVDVVRARVVVSTRPPGIEAEAFPEVRSAETTRAQDRISRAQLRAGQTIAGPAVIADAFSSLFVAPGWNAGVGSQGSLRLDVDVSSKVNSGGVLQRDAAIELELFTCRFTALVEEMGDMLQRCALSLNVKERLDYSCALLDAQGELVANAPHIPVHLGALGLCVRMLREAVPLERGDVVVTNHPAFGGSHLPDVTLVAPVHDENGALLGYVANRAHHAEIGGIRPGSMPPAARSLEEEGVVIPPLHLVRGGRADWSAIAGRLRGARWPSRAVDENLADLHAQLAAIQAGAGALRRLAARHGSERAQHFMRLLRERAASALAEVWERLPEGTLHAADAMDDGTPIVVRCSAARDRRGLVVDFAGSGGVHPGNLNATPAIVRSALLYVLRLLAGRDLPLNEGLMRDVELRIPEGLLAPRFPPEAGECPAVAGGNVETSQRVVDVLLRALGIAACSQGTMNNVTLGIRGSSYYETIGGGTGAGPACAGADAVQSHMTNTAITDTEMLELRLPLRVERFGIRRGSGGAGKHWGGDGIERRWLFLAPGALSMLAQRRRHGPPGLAGGMPGLTGQQRIVRADGTVEVLPGSSQADVAAGDCFIIETPGGGGWGRGPHEDSTDEASP